MMRDQRRRIEAVTHQHVTVLGADDRNLLIADE